MVRLRRILLGWKLKKLLKLKRKITQNRLLCLNIVSFILFIWWIQSSNGIVNSLIQYVKSITDEIQPPIWRWRLVPNRTLAVYAAYLDYKDDPSSAKQVLVMSCINRGETRPLYCHFLTHYVRSRRAITTVGPVRFKVFQERNNVVTENIEGFLECPLNQLTNTPFAVRISDQNVTFSNDDGDIDEWIPIYSSSAKPMKTVWCIGPLYDRYDEVQVVVEQLEWAKLQGFDQVIAYVDEVNSRVMTVLRHYEREEGLVQIIDWSLPRLVNRTVYYLGQMSILNDCVYRNKHHVQYVFLHDIDERVIDPHQVNIMNRVDSMFKQKMGAIILQSAFFKRSNPHNGSGILLYSNQKSNFYPRTKMIVKPQFIQLAEVHDVKSMVDGYSKERISVEQLYLAHFRFETIDIDYFNDTSLPNYIDIMAPIVAEKMNFFSSLNTVH